MVNNPTTITSTQGNGRKNSKKIEKLKKNFLKVSQMAVLKFQNQSLFLIQLNLRNQVQLNLQLALFSI